MILHSAELAPFALLDPASPQAEIRILEADPAPAHSVSGESPRTRELVIVDVSTPDYRQLVDDIVAQGDAGREIELVLIDPDADGIRQISDALSGFDRLDAVHIVSHGSDGALRLGAAVLDAAALEARGAEIEAWSRALSADADLLIYGCDVAATAEGRSFVEALAQLTGADVAASDDLTGSAALGGDWQLEYRAGTIDARTAISASAQQNWQGSLANSAPVLTGTNNLPTINEDPAANNGIKVSLLISGKVTDADPGALSGIAVVAIDDTNGVWQYTTNGGGAWTDFGAVSASSARLLSDDANTSVRFVPNANWNGTVAGGITFRAWDQTSGAAGATADTSSPAYTVRDEFDLNSYSNNDGTASWSAGWVDSDGSFSSGQIQITGNALEFNGALLSSSSIVREANLAGATSAMLSFDFNNQIGLSTLTLEVSSGGSYTQIANSFAGGVGTANFDLSAYASANTSIRLTISGLLGGGTFTVDNLEIAYVQPLSGGTTAFSNATASANVTVTAVNDRPVGTDGTVVTAEDTAFVFTTASFGFTDPDDTPANNLLAVKITALPVTGTLTLSGVALAANQTISRVDIAAGNLAYMPAANANGAGSASFTFKVQDDGGGADTDTSNRTMTIDITAVNDAPVGTDATVAATEDTQLVFTTAMFGYTDPSDSPANNFFAVKIETLPGAGALTLNGVAVTPAQSIAAADITAGKLKFAAAANANGAGYASFTFRVQDDGGGASLDTAARTMTIDVTAVNDAPVGTSRTVVAVEDTPFAFTVGDFGYTDPADAPASAFAAVKIETAPGTGSLLLNGVAIGAGAQVSVADIAAGKLVYAAAADAHGAGYASFTFRVQDSGGGLDLDAVARTITIDVTSVNDAPAGTSGAITATEDTAFTFSTAAFGFSDIADAPANAFASLKIISLTGSGALMLNGVAVSAGQNVAVADIAAGKLVFAPGASDNGAGYASFTFAVQDDGGIAGAGIDLDPVARTMTINVTAVNDAPAGLDARLSTNEDTAFVFDVAVFGFSDPGDTAGNNPLAVKITTLPGAGTLTLNGVALVAGDFVSFADIAAGRLAFAASTDANGAGYASLAFQLQDDGGTADGGSDLDAVARTITFDVAPINDAPSGTGATVAIRADASFMFAAKDFGFGDAKDTPANAFSGVKITSAPAAGSLSLAGARVATGQLVGMADIAAGRLVYASGGGSGTGYGTFTFQVQDDGGGADLDVARTFVIDVTPAPAAVVDLVEVAGSPAPMTQQPAAEVRTSAAPAAAAAATVPQGSPAAPVTAAAGADSTATAGPAVVEVEPLAAGATSGAASSAQFVQVGVQRLDAQQGTTRDSRTVSLPPVQDAQALLALDRVDMSGGALALASGMQAATAASSTAEAVESRVMLEQLDQMREGLQEHAKLEASVTAASAATGVSLSVGYVVWLLRGGVLVSTLLSSLPAWRLIDPLPVLGRIDDEDDSDAEADDSLESLVANNGREDGRRDEKPALAGHPETAGA